MNTKVGSILIAAVLFVGNIPAHCENEYDAASVMADTAQALLYMTPNPEYGDEWTVFSVARTGFEVPEEYYRGYYKNISEYVDSCGGVLSKSKYTEYSRLTAALNSIGAQPADMAGYDMTAPLKDFNAVIRQGINGAIWAILAEGTDECGYADYIMSLQLADGGFALSGESADPDVTAMAIQALCVSESNADEAVNRAVECLSLMQNEKGGYSSWGIENCESTAQVIIALCTAGISLTDERFVKNGISLEDALYEYYSPQNGFRHTLDAENVDIMSTQQSLCALAAMCRYADGKPLLYNMCDALNVVFFEDIEDSPVKNEIEAMAKQGIINGKSTTVFDPYSTMTRAEFAAAVVKAMWLSSSGTNRFLDVTSDDWFYPYVIAASENNIVNGISDTEFAPYASVTREQAALMLSRCVQTPNSIAPRLLLDASDYSEISDWAKEGAAICFNAEIFTDIPLRPKDFITREEAVAGLYALIHAKND